MNDWKNRREWNQRDNGGQILQDIFWLQKYDFYWEKHEEIFEGFEVAGGRCGLNWLMF